MEEGIKAYKLTQSLGDGMEEGTVLHLPADKGDALVEAGLAELASEEDVAGGGEDTGMESEDAAQPMVANAAKRLTERLEKSVAETVARAMAEVKAKAQVPTVPAQ